MLGNKNTYNRGKYSLALPLQHLNLQFFDIFKIGVTERVEKEVDFKHVIPCVFQSKWVLWFAAVYRRRRRKFLTMKMSL